MVQTVDIDDDKEEEEDDDSYKKQIIIYPRQGLPIHNVYYLVHKDIEELVIKFYNPAGKMLGFYPYQGNGMQWMLRGAENDGLTLHRPDNLRFPNIKVLHVHKCGKLKYLLNPEASVYLLQLKRIIVRYCKDLEGITPPETLPPGAFANLEDIFVFTCQKMKTVVATNPLPHLQRLKNLKVEWCFLMEEIIALPVTTASTSLTSLTMLVVEGCESIIRLLPANSLPLLPELQHICVSYCTELEAVIGRPSGCTSSRSGSFYLQKLKSLELYQLSKLRSVFENGDAWFCDSIEKICAFKCPNLKSIPIIDGCPSPSSCLKKIIIDSEQWELLQWEQPGTKNLLRPFVRNPDITQALNFKLYSV